MSTVPIDDPLAHLDDPLGAACLGPDGEPRLGRATALLPPLVGPTFLGLRDLPQKVVVQADGTVEGVLDQPLRIEPGDLACYGDSLPGCLDMAGLDARGVDVRRLLFALQRDGQRELWWLEQEPGARCHVHRGDGWHPASGDAFEQALEALVTQQAAEVDSAAGLLAPDAFRLPARVSLLRALGGFVGRHPKYGWGWYEGPEHDAFPPTIISLGHALIDVSLLELAQELLGHWLGSFVRADGSFDYYGPSLSEYGMMLDLVARLARASRDRVWFDEVAEPFRAIADGLVAQRAAASGLVAGIPEADYHNTDGAAQTAYYGNNLWAVRGLLNAAALLGEPGAGYDAVARPWLNDIQWLLHADLSELPDGTPFVPYAAGGQTAPPALTADRDASYANYRFYPEMLSSRLLTEEQAEAIFRMRETLGGELCGTTRLFDVLDDWPAMDMGLAHLDHGRALAAQRLLVGHLAYHHAAGHQTAYESVTVRPGDDGCRHMNAGYCTPVQLVAPRLLRSLLVHEAADALWLGRGAFLAWLPGGYGVEDVTTRWGRVSYRMQADGDGVQAEVDAQDVQPEVPVRIRLRRPDGRPITRLEVNGAAVDVTGETVLLPRSGGAVSVRAS